MRYQQAEFDTMTPGLRSGDRSRPDRDHARPTPFMKKLVAKWTMSGSRAARPTTMPITCHQSPDKVRELCEGTRLGRQELQGDKWALDPQHAVSEFSMAAINGTRCRHTVHCLTCAAGQRQKAPR
jgi:phage terminase large subunit-like protein